MADLVLEFLPFYLPCVIALIAATPILLSRRVEARPGKLVALAAISTVIVAVFCTLISSLIGWLPFEPFFLLFAAVPAGVAGAFLGLAVLVPFPTHSPRSRLAFRAAFSMLASVPLLLAALFATMPIWAPMPP